MCNVCQHDSKSGHVKICRRQAIKTAFGIAAAVAAGGLEIWKLAPGAQAANHVPTVIGCGSWGARPSRGPIPVLTSKPKKIIVHHTAFPNSTDYTLGHACKLARDIQNLHMGTNGWIDTGQHFLVSRGGYLLEGRHRSLETLQAGNRMVLGTHCPGMNNEAIGIENEGTYINQLPPKLLWNSLVDLCVLVCQQYGLNANVIFGHWDFKLTECPGRAFYRQFPELRRQVATRLQRIYEIPLRTWPDQHATMGGPVVRVLQHLLNAQGIQLPVNGVFSAQMKLRVQAFQATKGIIADGYTRNNTWEALVIPLKKQPQGAAAAAIQELLQHKGYAVRVNGSYDAATRKAVQEMQTLHGLVPNGQVDVDTWCAIVGGIVKAEFTNS